MNKMLYNHEMPLMMKCQNFGKDMVRGSNRGPSYRSTIKLARMKMTLLKNPMILFLLDANTSIGATTLNLLDI